MIARLGPVHLSNQRPIEWTLAGGVMASRTRVEVTAQRANQVPLGKAITLVLPQDTFSGVYALGIHPASTPHTRLIDVADGRWQWQYIHVEADYNLRRETGNTWLVGRREEVAQLKAEVKYWKHSLRGEKVAWTAREVLIDVLDQVVGIGKHWVPVELPKVEIEDLQLAFPGHLAIQKVLAYIPGANIRWDPDGRAHVYLEYDQSERKALSGLLVHTGADYPQLVDLRAVRPERYRVLFQTEAECRFDFDAARADGDGTISGSDMRMENIIPNIDPELDTPDGAVGPGAWVKMSDYLTALAAFERPAQAPEITEAVIREHYLSGFARLRQRFIIPSGSAADAVDPKWESRLSNILTHWRRTFRPQFEWRQRFYAFFAKRLAVIDRESGARAESEAYCDYVVRPSWRGFAVKKSQRHDHGWVVHSGLDRAPFTENTNLADAYVAPFRVRMISPRLMIWHVEPRVDGWGESDSVAPGVADGDEIPALAPSEFNQFKENYRALWEWVKLDSDWVLSVVVSGVRAHPNGKGRLHEEVVEISELKKFFKPAPKECLGPECVLRVEPGLMTAAFMWMDSESTVVRSNLVAGLPLPANLLLNEEHVRNVAVAMAAQHLEVFLDRVEGTFLTRGNSSLKPTGSLVTVTHRLDPQGRAQTLASAQLPVQARNLFAYLPPATRKFMLNILHEQG